MNTQTPNQSNNAPAGFQSQSQSDRWIKYGSNVVLSVVLVIVLAALLILFGEHTHRRLDTTAGGSLSLKPQTVNVVHDLKGKITLVSLYAHPDKSPDQEEQAQRVSDLLDEYRSKNSRIDVKIIDPIKQKDRVEELHQDFISRYGGQIKAYKEYLDDWTKQIGTLKKLTDAEAGRIQPFVSYQPGGKYDSVSDFVRTMTDVLPQKLDNAKSVVDHELRQKHPDYKAAATAAKKQMEEVADLATAVITQTPDIQQAKDVPADFKTYLATNLPNYQQIKTIADDSVASASKLGELKVDQLEQALNVENPILVLGESDWKIIPERQVWQDDTDVKSLVNGGKVKPRFAGEQQVTTAIYALENPKKQKICFVRASGQPLTQPGFPPFIPGGPLSMLAERLREYNFDVTEKDLSGNWPMQAQMQRMPSPPEPSDEEIRDAIWVVLDLPAQQDPQNPAPSPLGRKLKEHLSGGGSALLLADIRGENLVDALKDWGVELHPDAVAIHEPIALTEASASDPIEKAKARPHIWDCREYGDHPLARPIKNLDSVFVAPIVVRTTDQKGYTITNFLPFSANMPGVKTWGDAHIDELGNGAPLEFHPDKGDLPAPIFGGAIVEKQGGGRLVVIGSVGSFTNSLLRILDPRLVQRDPSVRVNRFPGNQELATNSIFWLAHLEPMIAISPSAMDVSRIEDMSKGALLSWHIGMLLLLPAVVLAAGVLVFVKRSE